MLAGTILPLLSFTVATIVVDAPLADNVVNEGTNDVIDDVEPSAVKLSEVVNAPLAALAVILAIPDKLDLIVLVDSPLASV